MSNFRPPIVVDANKIVTIQDLFKKYEKKPKNNLVYLNKKG